MAMAAMALQVILRADQFNGHVKVLHLLEPSLRVALQHFVLQPLSTSQGRKHIQHLDRRVHAQGCKRTGYNGWRPPLPG